MSYSGIVQHCAAQPSTADLVGHFSLRTIKPLHKIFIKCFIKCLTKCFTAFVRHYMPASRWRLNCPANTLVVLCSPACMVSNCPIFQTRHFNANIHTQTKKQTTVRKESCTKYRLHLFLSKQKFIQVCSKTHGQPHTKRYHVLDLPEVCLHFALYFFDMFLSFRDFSGHTFQPNFNPLPPHGPCRAAPLASIPCKRPCWAVTRS